MTRPVPTPKPAAAPPIPSRKFHLDLRFCLIPGESPAELESLTQAFLDQYRPINFAEEWLVRAMILSQWHKHRWSRVEASLIASAPNLLALVRDSAANTILIQVQRRLAVEDTRYARALAELRRMQKPRTAPDSPCQPKEKSPVADNWLRSAIHTIPPNPASLPMPAALPTSVSDSEAASSRRPVQEKDASPAEPVAISSAR